MKPIPVKIRVRTQPFVVGACLIERDGQFLLVQENQVEAGTWNHPAGWLDIGEDIVTGAKREAEEETGRRLEITGFLGVYAILKPGADVPRHGVKFVFIAQPLPDKSAEPKIDKKEIQDAKWFTLEEVQELKKNKILRDCDILNQIKDYQAGKIYPTEVIKDIYDQLDYQLKIDK